MGRKIPSVSIFRVIKPGWAVNLPRRQGQHGAAVRLPCSLLTNVPRAQAAGNPGLSLFLPLCTPYWGAAPSPGAHSPVPRARCPLPGAGRRVPSPAGRAQLRHRGCEARRAAVLQGINSSLSAPLSGRRPRGAGAQLRLVARGRTVARWHPAPGPCWPPLGARRRWGRRRWLWAGQGRWRPGQQLALAPRRLCWWLCWSLSQNHVPPSKAFCL